jgi:hypothetical protein
MEVRDMVRVFVAALLAAVVLFAWGAAWWTALPFAGWAMKPTPNEEAVSTTLKANLPESGTYFFPFRSPNATPEEEKALMERHRQGPLVEIIYLKDGLDPMAPAAFAVGFAQMVLSTLAAGALLCLAAPALRSYLERVGFVVLLAVFAVATLLLSDIVWFHHPWAWPTMRAGFVLSGWLLAALILGAIIRPARVVAAPTFPAPHGLAGQRGATVRGS